MQKQTRRFWELEEILQASQEAGVAVQLADKIPVPVPFKKAIVFDQQAQIHPLKYIYSLAREFIKKGGRILQNTMIQSIENKGNIRIAAAENTSINAKKLYTQHRTGK